MEKLSTLIESSQCFVLFPSKLAVDSSNFVDLIKNRENEIRKSGKSEVKPVTLIILDGTWREARRMRHHSLIKDLPQIQLSMSSLTGYKSRFIARQKSEIEERMCTLEAFSLLLREMNSRLSNETQFGASLSENSDCLFDNLDTVMDGLLRQIGMKEKSNFKRINAKAKRC